MYSFNLHQFEASLPSLRILVIGDLMLDRYLWGDVNRISPEAPVPIVDIQREECRPGGAANVALNVATMGAQVALCGVVGSDEHGTLLMGQLRRGGFDTGLVQSLPDRITTAKTRVIAQGQHVVRIDHERRDPISAAQTEALIARILERLGEFDAVVFEDYDKGVISPELVRAVVDAADARGVPTVVDPKYRNFMAYSGVTLFKPNLKELNEALGLRVAKTDIPAIVEAVATLRGKMPHAMTLITLSEQGVLAIDKGGEAVHIPAHPRKILDVSGAGDTVVALMALGLAGGLELAAAAAMANLGGGLVCEEVGVVPVDRGRLFGDSRALSD